MNVISYTVQGNIVGSWQYRVPVAITLAELPTVLSESGFVFRFELPLQSWQSAGLLCSNLEDLMFTDANSVPLPFYIYKTTSDRSVVYVRYTAAITSSYLTIYVLLKNTQLCGSGRTFSTLSTFDMINPRDFADDFGYSVYYSYLSYNAILITASSTTTVKAGKTWYDFVAFNSQQLFEQHGSTVFYNTSFPSFKAGDEILVYIDRKSLDSVLVYADGSPLASFQLSQYNASPALYLGYRDVQFAAAFKMLMYSYSVGQLTGGFAAPQQIVKTTSRPATGSGASGVDWMTLFLMVFALLGISLAVRWVNESRGGGPQRPVNLP